jgi:polyhydroxybutyrate depolymerase
MRYRRAVLGAAPGALAVALAMAFGLAHATAGLDAQEVCGLVGGGSARVSVAVPGEPGRSALVHLPQARRGRLALLLALHGTGGSGAFMERYSGLSRLADRAGFAVAYPDSHGRSWRVSGADDDVRFLDALIDDLLAGGCFDPRRVSAAGVSNGAGMAARFACAGDDRLAGLVSVAGGYGSLAACRARRALSVLEIHGTADRVVPYRGTAGDVLRWLRGWVVRDACARRARRTHRDRGVIRLEWAPCKGGTAVAHLRLLGGAHAWPGAHPPDPGPNLGVSAAQETWEFLRPRRLASAR